MPYKSRMPTSTRERSSGISSLGSRSTALRRYSRMFWTYAASLLASRSGTIHPRRRLFDQRHRVNLKERLFAIALYASGSYAARLGGGKLRQAGKRLGPGILANFAAMRRRWLTCEPTSRKLLLGPLTLYDRLPPHG